MRKYAHIMILSAAVCSAFSCTGLRHAAKVQEPVGISCDTDYRFTDPERLSIEITAMVPEEFRNPNTGIIVVPVLCGADSTQRLELKPFTIEGSIHSMFNSRKDNYEPELQDSIASRSRYIKDTVSTTSSTNDLQIEEWMRDSRVRVDVYADSYTRRVHLSEASFPIRIEDLNRYADLDLLERYYYTDPSSGPQTELRSSMNDGFRFSLDSYSIEDGEIASALKAYAGEVLSSYRTEDYKVSVTVSNSPEGSIAHNRMLGQNRLQSAKCLLLNAGVDTAKCTFSIIEENWEGVRKAVSEGTSGNKGKILEIIDQEQDPDIREVRIRDGFYKEWRQLRKETYPGLRYCDIQITGNNRPDSFSPEGEDRYIDIYGLNNDMLGRIRSGEYDCALTIADSIPNTATDQKVISNKATLYLRAGRASEAMALLRRCPDIAEARYNLAVLYISARKYSLAEPLLKDRDCINKALVKVALGKTEEARDVLLLLSDSPARNRLIEITEE